MDTKALNDTVLRFIRSNGLLGADGWIGNSWFEAFLLSFQIQMDSSDSNHGIE
jgi:hypothetical protein